MSHLRPSSWRHLLERMVKPYDLVAIREGRPHNVPGSSSSPPASQSPAASGTSYRGGGGYGSSQGGNLQGFPGAGHASTTSPPQVHHSDQAQQTRRRVVSRTSYSSSGQHDPFYLSVPPISNYQGYSGNLNCLNPGKFREVLRPKIR